MSNVVTSYCGLDCDTCSYRKTSGCHGCRTSEGHPFYGSCSLASCTKQRKIRFCGECGEFPCDLLKKYSYDKEQGDNGKRIQNCKDMKTAFVKEAREGIDAVSICGMHCDYCFMAQWCGSCRSSYNCCSYATIFPDGCCPNATCAKNKGLDGCYECEELLECKKGYYEKEEQADKPEYSSKATALFIQKYGKEQYTIALKKAIDAGVSYPESFDMTGSVAKALKLLETYI